MELDIRPKTAPQSRMDKPFLKKMPHLAQRQSGTLAPGAEAPAYDLTYTPELAAEMAPLYERVKHVIPPIEWPFFAPKIKAINELKKRRNAVILAHNYQTPEIFHGVADFVGDSLQLAKEAANTDADIIVQAGVHFMAETAKLLSPSKTVLIPDMSAGCSLASSITGEDVRLLKAKYPGIPVVTYVNTSADVKAECDICCTSSNAVQVVESLGVDTVIMVPDQYLARNVAAQTKVRIITWKGECEVHEQFTGEEIRTLKENDPSVVVLAHPECPPDVIAESDFAGSTAAMIGYVHKERPPKVVMVTECSMSDNVAVECPDVEFTKPCNLCPHMKRISLDNILTSLETMTHEVVIPEDVAVRARRSVERMVNLKLGKAAGPYDFAADPAEKHVPIESKDSVRAAGAVSSIAAE
ncbi:MAG: quinolinate synthase NadA [Pseudomonadota bacterium]